MDKKKGKKRKYEEKSMEGGNKEMPQNGKEEMPKGSENNKKGKDRKYQSRIQSVCIDVCVNYEGKEEDK